jgi:hypothetical protein
VGDAKCHPASPYGWGLRIRGTAAGDILTAALNTAQVAVTSGHVPANWAQRIADAERARQPGGSGRALALLRRVGG